VTTTPVRRLRELLSRPSRPTPVPDGGRAADAEARLAELDRLENGWRAALVRDKRINAHLTGLIDRAKITGGRVLEIGGREHPRGHIFDSKAFSYLNLDLSPGENTVVGDITDCPQIADNSYDVLISVDVFEHIDRPWLAAAELARILAPGGLVYTSTLFSWRYHPCPIDFWRYTPEALEFLFGGLVTLDKGFDLTERRRDVRKKAREDPMKLDAMGGWRENVRVFHAAVKPAVQAGPAAASTAAGPSALSV
jgi:SAM-dependent methyltransferase